MLVTATVRPLLQAVLQWRRDTKKWLKKTEAKKDWKQAPKKTRAQTLARHYDSPHTLLLTPTRAVSGRMTSPAVMFVSRPRVTSLGQVVAWLLGGSVALLPCCPQGCVPSHSFLTSGTCCRRAIASQPASHQVRRLFGRHRVRLPAHTHIVGLSILPQATVPSSTTHTTHTTPNVCVCALVFPQRAPTPARPDHPAGSPSQQRSQPPQQLVQYLGGNLLVLSGR